MLTAEKLISKVEMRFLTLHKDPADIRPDPLLPNTAKEVGLTQAQEALRKKQAYACLYLRIAAKYVVAKMNGDGASFLAEWVPPSPEQDTSTLLRTEAHLRSGIVKALK